MEQHFRIFFMEPMLLYTTLSLTSPSERLVGFLNLAFLKENLIPCCTRLPAGSNPPSMSLIQGMALSSPSCFDRTPESSLSLAFPSSPPQLIHGLHRADLQRASQVGCFPAMTLAFLLFRLLLLLTWLGAKVLSLSSCSASSPASALHSLCISGK